MSITPRGKGFQVYVKRHGKRYRVNAKTEAQALAWEREIIAACDAGRAPNLAEIAETGDDKTLGFVYDTLKARKWDKSRGGECRARMARVVLGVIGRERSINALDMSDVDKLVVECQDRDYEAASTYAVLSALNTMLTYASEPGRDWRTSRKLKMPWPKQKEGRLRFLVDNEEPQLLAASRADMADLWAFLLDTGLRINEALGLKWPDWKPKGVMVQRSAIDTDTTKGGKRRLVPLTERARSILSKARGEARERPFPYAYQTVQDHWCVAREAMGLTNDPEFVIHCLRHTFGSRLVQRGVSLRAVQVLLGHAKITTTERYAHLDTDALERAVGTLGGGPAVAQVAQFSKPRPVTA